VRASKPIEFGTLSETHNLVYNVYRAGEMLSRRVNIIRIE